MNSMSGYGVGSGNYGASGGRAPGERRRKLAAMAGNLYKTGAAAVNEIRESYNHSMAPDMDSSEMAKMSIPGSFPDVAIVTKGKEQMVLFPSYAKRHIKNQDRQYDSMAAAPADGTGVSEEDYWRQEWARHEDEKAIVDVDVRGWIYNPHRGPITRRNRMLIGLARQLSGIPAPRWPQPDQESEDDSGLAFGQEEDREQQSIAQKAREIERQGQYEKEAGQRGGYTEQSRATDFGGMVDRQGRAYTNSPPGSPKLGPRVNSGGTLGGTELNEAELALANANLMARIGPFMTTPLVQVPITLFFYNDTQSQSRTVTTDDAGHFITRAALDFVPTHVRVLASESISCVEPVQVVEPRGISMISDIDDTIKRSNIALGAKEIFRNTFVRELHELTVEGVKDWYKRLHDLGVQMHYCSNSPWQLYPVLATYFKLAGLPPGSLHLKQYSGMLQGIFEPVAERKRGTLEKILRDFPERKFLLVGDSGEADLEVYTDLAVAHPGRIVAVFIRDVTTPEDPGFFDSGMTSMGAQSSQRVPTMQLNESRGQGASYRGAQSRNALPPAPTKDDGPAMGDLIDFSEEPSSDKSNSPANSALHLLARKPVPPRPNKPLALRGSASTTPTPTPKDKDSLQEPKKAPPPPTPRRNSPSSHPLTQMQRPSELSSNGSSHNLSRVKSASDMRGGSPAPPPPPPRRRDTPSSVRSVSPQVQITRRPTGDKEGNFDLPSRAATAPSSGRSTPAPSITGASDPNANAALNRKVDLWRRRLERAHDTLDRQGVQLYTWRKGHDVFAEALGIVKQEMDNMGLQPPKPRRR